MKHSDFLVEHSNDKISYHHYESDQWYGVGGPNNPIFKYLVQRIDFRTFMHYEIYVLGGILEPWLSWDVDIVVKPPEGGYYDPQGIRDTMEGICKAGFEVGLFPDVSYTDDIRDSNQIIKDWKNMDFEPLEMLRLSNRFVKNGEITNYNDWEKVDGLYKQTWYTPNDKLLARGDHIYQPALRIK